MTGANIVKARAIEYAGIWFVQLTSNGITWTTIGTGNTKHEATADAFHEIEKLNFKVAALALDGLLKAP